MTFALFGLSIAFWINSYTMTIIFQTMFSGSFSIGWGPITWVMVSEIFPLHVRSKAMAICTMMNRLVSGSVALFFLTLNDALTPHGVFLMFAIISCLSIIFIYKCVPETKQKSLEEITKFLMRNYKGSNDDQLGDDGDDQDFNVVKLEKINDDISDDKL